MKLLDKKEVLQAKNLSRETEINEGAKLARKVDALRETVASEEKRLADFRLKTLENIRQEVGEVDKVRVALVGEIERLKREKLSIEEPSSEDWKKFEEKNEELIKQKQILQEERDVAERIYNNLRRKDRELAQKEEKLVETEEVVSKTEKETTKDRQKITETLLKTQKAQSDIEEYTIRRLQEISLKESEITDKEIDLNNQKMNFKKREEEFGRRMALLIDREQTLEREIKRQKR